MKRKVEVVIKQELFDAIGLSIKQLYFGMNNENDYRLCGSVNSDNEKGKGHSFFLKANFCDSEGRILYIDKNYNPINLEVVNYDTFSMQCSDISRFIFNLEDLDHIEIYPSVVQKEEEDW